MGATHGGDGALKMPSLIVPVRFPLALLVTNNTAAATIENVARFVISGPFLVDGHVLRRLRWSLQPSQTRVSAETSRPRRTLGRGSLPTPLVEVKKL